MRRLWKRFYAWAHTPAGDAILCGIGMMAAMVSVWAGSWLVWFLGWVK